VTPSYFIDRCLGHYDLPRLLREAGMDLVTHRDFGVLHDEEDVVWIPKVAKAGYVILTSDKDIRKNPLELQAVIQSRALYFVLGRGSRTAQRNAEIIKAHRRQIEDLARDHAGPLISQINVNEVKVWSSVSSQFEKVSRRRTR
jgi:hypothetical protein